MTLVDAAAPAPGWAGEPTDYPPTEYQPGVCNIGPAEVARRRRAANLGALATLALLVFLVVLHVPPLVRFAVALPAAGTAIAYMQVVLRFCVAFGSLGVFNFGALGPTVRIGARADRLKDLRRVGQMIGAGLLIGAAVGVLAVILPI